MTPLKKIDQLIKSGSLDDAKRELNVALRTKRFRVNHPAELANLSWRLGAPQYGLRILRPHLFLQSEFQEDLDPIQLAEYAVCLVKIGAFDEARWIFSREDVEWGPQANLYRGFLALGIWDYRHAIEHFRTYLSDPKLDTYTRRVGEVNLASALIYEDGTEEAKKILEGILNEPKVEENRFLYGYVLELKAAQSVLAKKHTEADEALTEVEKRWAQVTGLDRFFVDKWKAINEIYRTGKVSENFVKIKEHGAKVGHWESVRDCDRHQAVATNDHNLFLKLFFGTPFPFFRESLIRSFQGHEIPEKYLHQLSEKVSTKELTLFIDEKQKLALNLGESSFRLFSALASDFYRPFKLTTIFYRLNSDEFYNPVTSPKRIMEAIRRLKSQLTSKKLPLTIETVGGGYQLRPLQPVGIWLPRPEDSQSNWIPFSDRIKKLFGNTPFQVHQVATAWNIPRRTAIRRIQRLVSSGFLEKSGNGSKIKYTVK